MGMLFVYWYSKECMPYASTDSEHKAKQLQRVATYVSFPF